MIYEGYTNKNWQSVLSSALSYPRTTIQKEKNLNFANAKVFYWHLFVIQIWDSAIISLEYLKKI